VFRIFVITSCRRPVLVKSEERIWISSKAFYGKCELCGTDSDDCHIMVLDKSQEKIICGRCMKCLGDFLKLLFPEEAKKVEAEVKEECQKTSGQ
jgi:hypothetical protein